MGSMMSKSIVGAVLALGLFASATAMAQTEEPWNIRSEVGFVSARGNTTTETANAKLVVVRVVKAWKYTLDSTGLYGKNQDITSAQHVDGRLQADRSFGPEDRWFWFGSGRYEDDRFSGFEYQTTLTTGLGRKFYDTDTTKLTIQAGVGYRMLRPEQIVRDDDGIVVARILGERDTDGVVNGQLTFSHNFNEQTRILNTLLTESGEANTLTKNELALQVKMMQSLALSVGYSVRHNSDPLPGLKKTDTLTTLNLVYSKGKTE